MTTIKASRRVTIEGMTAEQKRRLLEAYDDGVDLGLIGRRFGVTAGAVAEYAKQHRSKRPNCNWWCR